MPLEIERKFLVNGDGWRGGSALPIRQGYLNRDPDRTVRIRVSGEEAWITVKGRTVGAVRSEFEYPVPAEDAESLLALCEKPILEKTRHRCEHGGRIWEIDEFHGENAGLVVAEIELEEVDADFPMPAWVGREVTHDPRYFNSSLSVNPFSNWRG